MAKNKMRVRVKAGQRGWYCGKLYYGKDLDPEGPRRVSDEFYIYDREHSVQMDGNGNPLVITCEQQFSHKWMEKIGPERLGVVEDAEIVEETSIEDIDDINNDSDVIHGRHPSEMTVKELKDGLADAGIEYPKSASKKDLIDLLEAFISDQS